MHADRRPLRPYLTFLLTLAFVASSFAVPAGALAASGSATLSQCANGAVGTAANGCDAAAEWVSGNVGASKAHYTEGDSLAYRLVFSNLSGGAHEVVIEWDTTKGGKHALDYLVSYATSGTSAASPCAGVAGCGGAPSTWAIPVDTQVAAIQDAGVFTLFGASITAVSPVTFPKGTGFDGDKTARVKVSFTTSQPTAVLAWGANIASKDDWGPTGSSGAITGSPYHTRLISLNGRGGNQDRSLSSDAVVSPSEITIVKQTPGRTGSFAFTASPLPLTDFTLDTTSGPDSETFSGITDFRNYRIDEVAAPGFHVESLTCSVASPNGGSYRASGASLTISLKEGETWTCTFTNEENKGNLVIAKSLLFSADPISYTTPFPISYSCTSGAADTISLVAGGTLTVPNLPAGDVCTVVEGTLPSAPAGYHWDPAYPQYSPATTVTVPMTHGASVTATVRNRLIRDTAGLELTKVLEWDTAPGTFTGPFRINYSCTSGQSGSRDVSAGETVLVTGLWTGTSCTVTEGTIPTAPTGYHWDAGYPQYAPSSTVTIPTTPDGSIGVTTTNRLVRNLGSLVIAKTLTGGTYAGTFDFSYSCGPVGGTAAMSGSVSAAAGGTATVSSIPTGYECTVVEGTLPAAPAYTHWGTTTLDPVGGSVTIPNADGSSVTVTVNNVLETNVGSLVISKTLTGGSAPGPFLIRYSCGASGSVTSGDIELAVGASTTLWGIPSGTACTVVELSTGTAPAGAEWGAPTFLVNGSAAATGSVTIPEPHEAQATVVVENHLHPRSQLTHTSASCTTFVAGTAETILEIGYSAKAGKITQVNPGVLFYWVRATSAGAGDSIVIDQTAPGALPPMTLASGGGIFTLGCTNVGGTVASIGGGDVQVTFPAAGDFIVGVKYTTGVVVGWNDPGSGATYTFEMAGEPGTQEGVPFRKKSGTLALTTQTSLASSSTTSTSTGGTGRGKAVAKGKPTTR